MSGIKLAPVGELYPDFTKSIYPVLTYDLWDIAFLEYNRKRQGIDYARNDDGLPCDPPLYLADYWLTFDVFANDEAQQFAQAYQGERYKFSGKELKSIWLWVQYDRQKLEHWWRKYQHEKAKE